MAYLPKEKLLIEADLVNTNVPLPATASKDQQTFYREVREQLKLDVSQIVPIHGKPIPWSDFAKFVGTAPHKSESEGN